MACGFEERTDRERQEPRGQRVPRAEVDEPGLADLDRQRAGPKPQPGGEGEEGQEGQPSE